MPSTYATTVRPVPRRFIALAREPQGTPGTLTAATWTFPMVTFTPVDKIDYLQDTAWRNAMAQLYGVVEGTRISDLSLGGPVFIDGLGYLLSNVFGDYYQSVIGAAGTATTVATGSAYTAGATTLTITTTNAAFVAGATIAVGTLGTTTQEWAVISSISTDVITLAAPLYQNHPVGDPVTPFTGQATATTLASAYTAPSTLSPPGPGSTSISVATATGISVGSYLAIGALGSTACEVRTCTAVTGTTITLNAPLYQGHASGAAVTPWPAPPAAGSPTGVIHNFALLNSGTGAGGWPDAQPGTLTITDYTGLPLDTANSVVTGARQYGFACLSELALTGDPSKLLEWDAKATALLSSILAAGSPPAANPTTTPVQASWDTDVIVGGVQKFTNSMWKATFTRKLGPFFDNNGQQDPFAIVRGYFTTSLALDWDPVSSEAEFLDYLDNTQPMLSIVAIGPGGVASPAYPSSMTINAKQAAFVTGEIDDSKDAFGFKTTADLVANTSNVGPSAGYGPCVVQIANQIVNY